MLYIIGLGLGDEKDTILRGLETVKICGKISKQRISGGKSTHHTVRAHESDIAFFVKLGVDVKVVHNASVMNGVRVCGLQLYCYGETCLYMTRCKYLKGTLIGILEQSTLGEPLHCLVIVGETHPVEDEMLGFYTLGEGK
ncbi:putative diphthine methyl ester synthase [Camellia lanceoleosa]|uniref:Diphthine methyl ester synthase n=1 Tax=Camellia lanceoleosa TaxID=1840588 RepID=A0ACC0HLD8_9ERIC|nr:putative diphthine methyl ester synthase [Camellia lanceoleosa]